MVVVLGYGICWLVGKVRRYIMYGGLLIWFPLFHTFDLLALDWGIFMFYGGVCMRVMHRFFKMIHWWHGTHLSMVDDMVYSLYSLYMLYSIWFIVWYRNLCTWLIHVMVYDWYMVEVLMYMVDVHGWHMVYVHGWCMVDDIVLVHGWSNCSLYMYSFMNGWCMVQFSTWLIHISCDGMWWCWEYSLRYALIDIGMSCMQLRVDLVLWMRQWEWQDWI